MKYQKIIILLATTLLISGCKGVKKADKPSFKKYVNEVSFADMNLAYNTFRDGYHFNDRSFMVQTDMYQEENSKIVNVSRHSSGTNYSANRHVDNYQYNADLNQILFTSQIKSESSYVYKGEDAVERNRDSSDGYSYQLKQDGKDLLAIDKNKKVYYRLEGDNLTISFLKEEYSFTSFQTFSALLGTYAYYVLIQDERAESFKFYQDEGLLTIVQKYEGLEQPTDADDEPMYKRNYTIDMVCQLVLTNDDKFTSSYQNIVKEHTEVYMDLQSSAKGDVIDSDIVSYGTTTYEAKKIDIKDIDISEYPELTDIGYVTDNLFR